MRIRYTKMSTENSKSKTEKKTDRKAHAKLLLKFLRKSKRFFIGSIIAALFYSLCDMIDPQIFRAAIDNAIGGKEADLLAREGGIYKRLHSTQFSL